MQLAARYNVRRSFYLTGYLCLHGRLAAFCRVKRECEAVAVSLDRFLTNILSSTVNCLVKIVTNSIPNDRFISLFIELKTKSIRYQRKLLPKSMIHHEENGLLESANPHCGIRRPIDMRLKMGIFVSSGRISPPAALMYQNEISFIKAQNAPESSPYSVLISVVVTLTGKTSDANIVLRLLIIVLFCSSRCKYC